MAREKQIKYATAPMRHSIDSLQKELGVAQSLHKAAVREMDYERTLCDNYKKEVTQLQKQLDFLKNIIEDSLDADPADCWYVLKRGYKAHYEKFFGIKEDRIGKDPGRARAAKTARIK